MELSDLLHKYKFNLVLVIGELAGYNIALAEKMLKKLSNPGRTTQYKGVQVNILHVFTAVQANVQYDVKYFRKSVKMLSKYIKIDSGFQKTMFNIIAQPRYGKAQEATINTVYAICRSNK